jgi:hypothetical protein
VQGDPVLTKGRVGVGVDGVVIASPEGKPINVCSINGSTAEVDAKGRTSDFAKVSARDYPAYLKNLGIEAKNKGDDGAIESTEANDLNRTEI